MTSYAKRSQEMRERVAAQIKKIKSEANQQTGEENKKPKK